MFILSTPRKLRKEQEQRKKKMAISSFNIQPSSGNATVHNHRVFDVAYAIDSEVNNEYQSFKNINQTRNEIYADYKEFHNKKLNTKATPIREAVVNLNEEHTMSDMIKLKEVLEEKYKWQILDIAIHRDEGHINEQGEKVLNLHAHIVFSNYDFETHTSLKHNRKDMQDLQTIVAETLNMQRGETDSKKVRLSHHEYKRAMQEVATKTQDLREEIKELKSYNFKDTQKEISSLTDLSNEQRKELHALNTKARADATKQEALQKQVAELLAKHKNEIELSEFLRIDLVTKTRELKSETELNDNLRKTVSEKIKEVRELQAREPEIVEVVKIKEVEKIVVDETALISALQATKELKAENDTLKSDLRALQTKAPEIKIVEVVKVVEVEKEKIIVDDLALNKALQDTKELKAENETLKSEKVALTQDMTILSTKNAELETDVKTVKAEFLNYKKSEATNSSRLHDSFQDLQNRLGEENNKVEYLETELESKNKALQATKPLIAENVSLKQEKIVLERDMSVLSTKNAELEIERVELSKYKVAFENLKKQFESVYYSLKLKGAESFEHATEQIKEKFSSMVKKDEIVQEPVKATKAEAEKTEDTWQGKMEQVKDVQQRLRVQNCMTIYKLKVNDENIDDVLLSARIRQQKNKEEFEPALQAVVKEIVNDIQRERQEKKQGQNSSQDYEMSR